MSNKRIGCENFGKFYTEGKVRNRREWRGVTDKIGRASCRERV